MSCGCSPFGAAAPASPSVVYFYWTISAGGIFFAAWNGTNLGATEPNGTIFMPRPGGLRNLRLSTPDGSNVAADQTATIRVNGINTTLNATVASGQPTGSSAAVVEAVALFSRVSLIMGAAAAGPLIASVELG